MKKIISLLLSIISISVYGQDFSLVVIPDTQYETADTYGNPQMLYSQTQWIADNKTDSNIVYVSHVGDITQSNLTVEWQRADTAMSIIENADIPFSLCTGNHDGLDNTDFDDYFGADRFTDKSWYGGHYSTSNVNNYSFFEEGGMEFMVIHLQYAVSSFNAILHWASDLLKTYSEKRAIVVSHDILEPDGDFSAEGQEIYDSLKANPNLFLMWGGHYHTAPLYGSRRTDVYNGNTIHTVMSCYQHTNGGDGWIRLAKFSPADDSIYVSTYSPYLDQYWPDMDENYFSLYYNMPYAEDIRPHVFYVQDPAYNANASDSNVGNDIDYPWATWQHAFDMAGIGDTVYFRGGVWYSTERVLVGSYGHPAKVGKPDSLICFMNYPGETPILDCRNHTTTGHDNGLNISYSYYIKLRGLTVRYCRQRVDSQYITGIEIGYAFGGPVWLERLTSHGNWGNGIEFAGYDTLYVTSCDSYDNADSLSITTGIGNRADGFGGGSGGTETDTFKIAYWEGCRSWHNSDDGFDFGTSKQIQVTNCWSFLNGYLPEGGGIGFKTGPSHVGISSKRRIYKTLAAFNNYPAYADQNMDDAYYGPVVEYSNNTSYKNQIGFISDNNTFNCNTGRAKVKYNNNLVYKSRMSYFDQMYLTLCHSAAPYYPHYATFNNNTWIYRKTAPYWLYNPAVSVTDADFVLIDSTLAIAELTAARKSDGSLPDITFLTLVETSDLINAGMDVGLDYNGAAPDLGYAEYYEGADESTEPLVSTTSPITITSRTATGGGIVTSDGGETVTSRGVCWSTSANPTTADSKTAVAGTTGAFTSAITGLSANTTYHVRAYATNSIGTGYGADISFTTDKWNYLYHGGKIVTHNGKPVIVR